MSKKTILITGSTDGIGLATAEHLASQGHHVLIHGRSPEKVEKVEKRLSALPNNPLVEGYVADLSDLQAVSTFAESVLGKHSQLDVLINNAGVFKTKETITKGGLDVRFVVNAIAPYLLTQKLLPVLGSSARVVNVSSAAQAPVDLNALLGHVQIANDFSAYAQSKLAITMWSRSLGLAHQDEGPMIVAVNPGSMLGSKMVKEGFGVAGGDIRIGMDILTRAALSEEFATASGQYFDNDAHRFSDPHQDALDSKTVEKVILAIHSILA